MNRDKTYNAVNGRPPSGEMGDLHMFVMPPLLWRDHLHSAIHHIISETISAGFLSLSPDTTLHELRDYVSDQMGYEVVPRDYVYLKCVGRVFTKVRSNQEHHLRVRNFPSPQGGYEIMVLDSILANASGSSSVRSDSRNYELNNYKPIPPIGSPYTDSKATQTDGLDENERRRLEELRRLEEERRRRFEEEERRRRLEEEEEERRRREEERRRWEEQQRWEEERRRRDTDDDEERRRREEEERRRQEEEERRRREEEERRRRERDGEDDEERRRREEEERRRREEEERRRREEEERRRREEEERRRREEEEEERRRREAERTPSPPPINKDAEKERLREEIERLRAERQELERKREELVKRCKVLQGKTHSRRNQARDVWKKRYFEEKKKTPPLEDKTNKLRQEMDNLHRRIMSQLEGSKDPKDRRGGAAVKPSEQGNLKIQATRTNHEIEDLKRKVENVKIKLTSEMKLRNQAETELRSLRADLTQKKIDVTLQRSQQIGAMTGINGVNSDQYTGRSSPSHGTPRS